MLIRPPLSPFIAMEKPVPSPSAPPSIASAGTRTPSKTTWAVGWACQPIFSSLAPKLSPGVPFSTMNAEMPRGPVTAGAGHHDVDVRCARSGDELLDAVEHIVVAVADGLGAQRAGVRPRTRLGQAVTGDRLHRGQLRHQRLALFVRAVRVDHPRAHVVDGQERGDRGVGGGQLFEDAHGVDAAQSASTGVLTAVDRRHPQLGSLTQLVDREVMRAVPLQRIWGKPLFSERARRLGDYAFVVVQAEELHVVPTSLSGWRIRRRVCPQASAASRS